MASPTSEEHDPATMCAISLDVMENPVTLPCQHAFEKSELEKMRSARQRQCPECRTKITDTFLKNMRVDQRRKELIERTRQLENTRKENTDLQRQVAVEKAAAELAAVELNTARQALAEVEKAAVDKPVTTDQRSSQSSVERDLLKANAALQARLEKFKEFTGCKVCEDCGDDSLCARKCVCCKLELTTCDDCSQICAGCEAYMCADCCAYVDPEYQTLCQTCAEIWAPECVDCGERSHVEEQSKCKACKKPRCSTWGGTTSCGIWRDKAYCDECVPLHCAEIMHQRWGKNAD